MRRCGELLVALVVASLSTHCRFGYDEHPRRRDAGTVPVDAGSTDASTSDAMAQDARLPADAMAGDAAAGDAATDAASDAAPVDSGPTPDATLDAGMAGPVIALSRGFTHSCAIAEGRLFCWGDNQYFKLGLGPLSEPVEDSPVEVPIPDAANPAPGEVWHRACAAEQHTCAITSLGRLACWGRGIYGKLGLGGAAAYDDGDPDKPPVNTPTFVEDLSGFIELGCQGEFGCALHEDRTVYCWGSNGEGQLGTGDRVSIPSPNRVPALSGVDSLSVGQGHSCVLLQDQSTRCWGRNSNRQISVDPAAGGVNVTEPFAPTGEPSVAIEAGQTHTCLITTEGELRCWGDQAADNGENGRPLGEVADVPTRVNGSEAVEPWKAIALSLRPFGCAITAADTGYCWGNGEDGQLGNGVTADDDTEAFNLANSVEGRRYTVQAVIDAIGAPTISTWRSLAASGFHICGVKLPDNSLWCWGKNHLGQLGIGSPDTTLRASTPRRVTLPL